MLIHNTVVIPIVCFYKVQINYTNYCKREKIRWAKHLRFHPYEGFHGNIFTVPWPVVCII